MTVSKADLHGFCLQARELVARGHLEDALRLYNRIVLVDPDNERALSDRGIAYAMAGQVELAIADLERSFALGFASAEASCAMGRMALDADRVEQALEWFDKAVEQDPNDPAAYHHRSAALLKAGRTEAALQDLNKCLELNPDETMRRLVLQRLRHLRKQAT